MQQQRTIKVADFEFTFACEAESATPIRIELAAENLAAPDDYLIRSVVKAESGGDFVIKQFSISWTVPVVDMHGLYFGGNPREELSHLPFWENRKITCSNTGFPYIALIHRNGNNRAAFGLLDQLTEATLEALLPEQTRCYHFKIQKPLTRPESAGGMQVSGQFEDGLFVSVSQQPWPQVLKSYAQTVQQAAALPSMPVPDHAYNPVFCSWTAIHHDVSHEWVMRNATVAAQLGFKTWITDDGWFIPEGRFADYSRTGDWEPCEEKFPDFREHVKAVQALGMRYVLWVSPFMIGKKSKAAQRYANLLTKGQERLNFNNLAPWLEESQNIIANLYERLVKDYDLDGLKVDFIDSFPLEEMNQDGPAVGRIGQSIFTALKCATERVLALKPDFLIEYRNTYTNLASRAHGNLYRSSDVPINPLLNRWQAVMLRLLAPDRAVHLDPALWHEKDTDENVAVHLINCLVSVPMVSIELDRYPQSHLDLIRYWIGFYNEHRETIIHGDFKPDLWQGHVPAILFDGRSESIISLYEPIPVRLDSARPKLWLLNASTKPYIEIAPDAPDASYEATLRDKFGKIVSKQRLALRGARVPVEIGGSAELIAQ